MRILTPRNIVSVFITCCSLLFIWCMYAASEFFMKLKQDRDISSAYQTQLCKAYLDQRVTGNLCYDLCESSNRIYLQSYTSHHNTYRLYWWNGTASIRVDEFEADGSEFTINIHTLPVNTTHGTFQQLVSQLLRDKVGELNSSHLLQYVLSLTDSDHNGKVSLVEATTLWTLLHNHDFLMRVTLRDDKRVGDMISFCGPVYSISRYPFTCHYTSVSQWQYVHWTTHVAIVLSLLEFIADINYDDGADGLHMCEMSVDHIAYSSHTDRPILLTDLTSVYTKWQLQRKMAARLCTNDTDCSFMRDCIGYCHQGTCQPYQTSLCTLCRVFAPYLYAGMPLAKRQSLSAVMRRCASLDSQRDDMLAVRYAVMFNELREQLLKLTET